MALTNVYPSTLPGPTSASFQSGERRLFAPAGGPYDARELSRDRTGTEDLRFVFNAAQVAIFRNWWKTNLVYGGAWFYSKWPVPQGLINAVRMFKEPPKYNFLGGTLFEVTAECELRGVGVLPANETDDYFGNVILFLNGDVTAIKDSSPRAAVFTAHGSVIRNTTQQKWGKGCIDVSNGEILVELESVYKTLLTFNEWTLRYWVRPTALPINVNNAFLSFAAIQGHIFADGSLRMTAFIAGSGISVLSAAGAVAVGRWTHVAFTRTNAPKNRVELFIDGIKVPVLSTSFGPTSQMDGIVAGPRSVGYQLTNAVLLDDFQLTSQVNRYRNVSTFTVPGKLPLSA